MGYIESNLLKDEKLVYITAPHWIIFWNGSITVFFALLVWMFAPTGFAVPLTAHWTLRDFAGIALFLVGAYWLITAYIYYRTSEYAVTDRRVSIKVGWIERESLELLLDKVEGVLVDQSIPGRIFNYGAITIIGTGGTKDRFPYIPDPLLFRKKVQEQIELHHKE